MVFKPQYSRFKYKIISFGLFNISKSFQDYIMKILAKKLDIFVIFYEDNILIYKKEICLSNVKPI